MRRRVVFLLPGVIVALAAVGVLYCLLFAGVRGMGRCVAVGRVPRIHPDYAGIVIPPNVAPLNFCVDEPGKRYVVKVSSARGDDIEIVSRAPRIVIPLKAWKRLLAANRGEGLRFDVSVKAADGYWYRYEPVTDRIAREPVDGWIVYRLINPLYNYYAKMSICQRSVEDYEERVIWDNSSFGGCMNCHTFLDNRPHPMLMHMRSGEMPYGNGMLLIGQGGLWKIDTRTEFSIGPAGFTSWHPSGRLVAFSMNKIRQFFHGARTEVRDGIDMDSDMAVYLFDSQTVTSTKSIARPDCLETWPAWSADGRYLYFCRAPLLWSDRNTVPPKRYAEVRYDLMRIGYDLESGAWGEVQTVLSSNQTGQSITQPRLSPDGRFLVFCMSDYSTFPTFQPSSDLYLMDLSTGRYEKMACSSERAESWHSWSSNSRWLVFSSKWPDGLFLKPYFTYVDAKGRASKPLVLPQKDPAFYDSFFRLYQMPELVRGPVPVKGEQISEAVMSAPWLRVGLPVTGATPRLSPAPDPLSARVSDGP